MGDLGKPYIFWKTMDKDDKSWIIKNRSWQIEVDLKRKRKHTTYMHFIKRIYLTERKPHGTSKNTDSRGVGKSIGIRSN